MSHALYIWGAYGVTVAVLIGLAVASLRGLKARESELARAEAALPKHRR
jgi:heme exporter protein CcmD